jgi:TatD DNase family protein
MIADSHAHLEMSQFDVDRADVIQRALDAGLELIIAVGTGNPEDRSIERTLILAENHDFIYAAIGVHPHDARLVDSAYWEELERRMEHPKVVLLGEIGLDYYYDNSPREIQRDAFRRQLRMARRRELPIVVHCRDAWPDLVTILREEWSGSPPGGVLHSFTGNREQALEGAELGFLISFSGIVTFKNAEALRDAARALSADQMLIETDCPYLAPVPHRGKRNEPAFVADVARTLAAVRQTEFEVLALKTTQNLRRLTGLV